MKKLVIAVLGLSVAACGGNGLSGKYVSTADANITMEFSGDNATVTVADTSKSGPVKKSDKSVDVTIGSETKTFTIDDKGCLVNGEIGTFCKK